VVEVTGEFAYFSTDGQGLRQASLTGGTLLSTPLIKLETAARERVGKVVKVDYWRKEIRIDQPWPSGARQRVIEIGTLPGSGNDGYVTQYTVTRVEPDGANTKLTVLRGADYFLSRIKSLDAEKGLVNCAIGIPHERGELAGLRSNWAATNGMATRFWRAEVLPADYTKDIHPFKLTGAPVAADAFGTEKALRLWEYGPGDRVRQSTYVSVRRVDESIFEVDLDVDATIHLKATSAQISSDRKTWAPLQAKQDGAWLPLKIDSSTTSEGPVLLRIE
jgi:hypothetical protein